MLSLLPALLRRVAFALPLLLGAPAVVGCSASAESSTASPAADGRGATFARGMLGVSKAALPQSATLKARRYEAVVSHLVALIEQSYPGQLDENVDGLSSKDPARVLACRGWLDGVFAKVLDSNAMAGALRSDPLFAGVTIKSDLGGLRLENTGSGGSGSGDGSGTSGDAMGDTSNLGRGEDGRFGDDRTGPSGLLADSKDVQPGLLDKLDTLKKIDSGEITPNPDSRLGAYAATSGYEPGTVGNAVHNAIGTIYGTFGTFGEENIGRVFNSPEAQSLYNQPVDSDAGLQMATIENQYWNNVRKEDPWSPGGNMGSAFSPGVRNWLQKHIF